MTEDAQAAKARAGKPEAAVLGQLRKKSHEELLFLVEQLLERQPDIKPLIELLIELPMPNAGQQGKHLARVILVHSTFPASASSWMGLYITQAEDGSPLV